MHESRQLVEQGNDHYNNERNAAALECFLRAIQLNPDEAEAYYGAAAVYFEEKKYEQTIKYLQCILPYYPLFGEGHRLMGRVLEETGLHTEARSYYLKAIEINPQDSFSYNSLGCNYSEEGNLSEAIKCQTIATQLDPSNWLNFYNLANNYYRKEGDMMRAEENYLKVIALQPHAKAYAYLGSIYGKRNDWQKARHYYENSLRLDPDLSFSHNGMGNVYRTEGDFKKALWYYLRATALAPDGPESFANLAQLPRSVNPAICQHFFRAIYLSYLRPTRKYFGSLLVKTGEYDSPMLINHIAKELPPEEWPKVSFELPSIQRAIEQCRPFDQLMELWQAGVPSVSASLAAALINYHMGDPVSSFLILGNELQKQATGLHLGAIYYYCLSAIAIIEREQETLQYAVKQADQFMNGQPVKSLVEKYYAALIYDLAGDQKRAIPMLRDLFPRFMAAGYQLAAIHEREYLKKYPSTATDKPSSGLQSPDAIRLIEDIKLEESVRPVYIFGIQPISPSLLEPEKFLRDIMPLVHFIEIQDMIGHVFPRSFELRQSFYNGIRLNEEVAHKESLSLKDTLTKAWKELIEREIDPEKLEEHYRAFSQYKHPAHYMGEIVEHGAKSELLDTREKHRNPVHFDFKLYLMLNYQLYKNNRISRQEAACINHYIYDCMESLPVFREGGAKSFVLKSIRDHFLGEVIPYVDYVIKLKELIRLIKEEKKGKKSPIMPFNEFYTMHETVMDL
jgi:tetratricopeptide (TPR) repeat protein